VLVALLERTEHGGLIRRARLLGDTAEQEWLADEEPQGAAETAERVASWLSERARAIAAPGRRRRTRRSETASMTSDMPWLWLRRVSPYARSAAAIVPANGRRKRCSSR